jgi:glycosyltransferase involved in cell wall biosynthesis
MYNARKKVNYISYGITKTGGYRHEYFLYKSILQYLGTEHSSGKMFRKHKLFYNIIAYFELLVWAFRRSNADINIVTARTGISAIIRNWFNKKDVWIVLHNYDPNDGKSSLLKWYYKLLFILLKMAKHNRFKIICVAPFFLNLFKNEIGIKNTFLFPNLFDISYYKEFQKSEKNKWVHLGQFSSKNDSKIPVLAKRLHEIGFYCFYSTLNPKEATSVNGEYDILYFDSFDDYLNKMSLCICTLALTRINEGWPRLSHESILVGTPIIGYANGGLGDLLKESKSMVVNSVDEVYECIIQNLFVQPSSSFTEKYDLKNFAKYTIQICPN